MFIALHQEAVTPATEAVRRKDAMIGTDPENGQTGKARLNLTEQLRRNDLSRVNDEILRVDPCLHVEAG